MSTPAKLPQTLTAMESGFQLRPEGAAEFWSTHETSVGVALAQPGFVWVAGGPIVNSSWLSFLVKFESPAGMDAWHHHAKHRPYQEMAKTRWFSHLYIRKWRLPADGEPLGDRIYCETEIAAERPLVDSQIDRLTGELNSTLRDLEAPPFETLTGQFEPHPYQLTGPLQAAPETKPAQYLLLTHWTSGVHVEKWLASPAYQACTELGAVNSQVFVPIAEEPGSRSGLRPDGLQRDWTFDPTDAAG